MPAELFWSVLRHRHAVNCGALAAATYPELFPVSLPQTISNQKRHTPQRHDEVCHVGVCANHRVLRQIKIR
jgi:hypothetical protein